MTDTVVVAAIAATPPTLVAVVAAWLGWVNRSKLDVVHGQINSRLTELLELTRTASHAEGMKLEHDQHLIAMEAPKGDDGPSLRADRPTGC